MWGKRGNSLSRHCGAMYRSFILQNLYKQRYIKKGKVSAVRLTEGPSGKTIKNIQIFIILRAFWRFRIVAEGRKSQGSPMMSILDAPLVITPSRPYGCAAKGPQAPAEFV